MARLGRRAPGSDHMPREDTMARPGMRELIGRAMIDKDFLTDLVRDPATVLGGYDLEAEERAAIMQAVARSGKQNERERVQALQVAMMKRWAT
jgi:hypothetical protein